MYCSWRHAPPDSSTGVSMAAATLRNPITFPDTGLLSSIIHELTVARRNVSSYPKGHPVVTSSCEKVAGLFAQLFDSRDELTMGVAKDSLVVDGHSFDCRMPVVRTFAKSLFSQRVALVTFQKGVTAKDVQIFSSILTEKRERNIARGGIEAVFRDAELQNVRVREIQYDAFHVKEDLSSEEAVEEGTLWESFVRELLRTDSPSSRITQLHDTFVGPEDLLGMIQGQPQDDQLCVVQCLADFLRTASRRGSLSTWERESFEKILSFVAGLDSELRRKFFEAVLLALESDADPALEILLHLPREVIQEVAQLCEENVLAATPLLRSVVERLAEHSPAGQDAVQRAEGGESGRTDGVERKLEVMFRETTGEEYIPVDYAQALTKLIALRDIPPPCENDLSELKQTLSNDCIEVAVSDIILDSFQCASGEQVEVLTRTLFDYSRYFLEIGDFRSLVNMYQRLRFTRCDPGHAARSVVHEMLKIFEETDFTREVLNGLDVWGREKFGEIASLIHIIGRPFVEPLLNRLAVEENRIVRRYCLDQLLTLAEEAREFVLARLKDERWYVVRNLLIILRHSGGPDLAMHLRRMAAHPHPKVRQQVLEMLLQLRDPEGDRLLLDDLTGTDPMVRLQAIQQAEKSAHPDIVAALLGILLRKGFSPESFTEKRASIRTLAEIGDPCAIPVLSKILAAWVFFRSSPRLALKKEIVQTLGRYHDPSAVELLNRIAQLRDPELSALARGQVRNLGRNRQ